MFTQEKSFFPFGASYCPFAKSKDIPMSEWEGDIIQMKKLGFTTLRSFTAWNRIEKKEGEFDFKKLDYIFELAEKYDMKIMLNVGGLFDGYAGMYAPWWLTKQYDCQSVVYDPYTPREAYGALKNLCLDDSVYTQKAMNFTVKIIKRYSRSRQLLAWVIWNEPFLKKTCFCPQSIARFQDWLKIRYDDNLDELNKMWGTEFPVNYESWDEVKPPAAAGFLTGGYVPRWDWLRFNEDNLASKVNLVHKLVKKHDPLNRPTTTNIDYSSVNRTSPETHRCCDIWKIGRALDTIGLSHYTLLPEEPSIIAGRLARIRSASNHKNKKFWIIETEAGPIRYDDYTFSAEGEKRKLRYWQAVAHGAKSILAWKYRGRISDTQTDEFNMVAWDGSITDRALVNGDVSQKLQELALKINKKSTKPQVAILASSESSLFSEITNSLDSWRDSHQGAYRFFWEQNIPADYIDNEHIKNNEIDNYKVLILPHCAMLSSEISIAITNFIKNGGLVIADSLLGARDENGIQNLRSPAFGLEKAFDGYINDMFNPEKNEEILIKYPMEIKLKPYKFIHKIHTGDSATILGQFSSSGAAVISNDYGKGRAIWFGTMLFAGYKNGVNENIDKCLIKILDEHGIRPEYKIDFCAGNEKNIEIRVLTAKDENPVLFILNHNEKEINFTLNIKSNGAKNLLTNEMMFVRNNELKINMPGTHTIILELDREKSGIKQKTSYRSAYPRRQQRLIKSNEKNKELVQV